MLDLETWQKIEQLYHTALTLELMERAAYLTQACAGDTVLQREVASLLDADTSAGNFLREPIVALGLHILADEEAWQQFAPFAPTIAAGGGDDLSAVTLDHRYEITERIGGGGMGDVYKACDTRMLNRPVVVKVLKADALGNEWVVSKFKQEIEAANKIDNPGVVSFFDIGEVPDGRPYLVMQYVEGQSLRQAIPPEQGMGLQEVAEVIKQLGRTLNIAHEKGIIHRDLKPENIMFRRDENGDLQIKVIDFGIAKIKASLLAASTSTDLVIGTPLYMSPEQLDPKPLHKRQISAASDVYSLGVITYEMVTGRRPFNPESAIHLAALQKEGVQAMPRALRPALPEAAQKVILKSLCYHPAERYQRARDFCDELSQALWTEDEVAPLPPPTSLPAPIDMLRADTLSKPQPAHQRRWLVAAMVIVLLSASAAVGVWMKYFRLGPERTFSYFLKVQKVRDGKPYEEPFISSGQEVYEQGYRFRLLLTSQTDGYVYLINESKDEQGQPVFYMLFPVPTRNGGVARVAAGQPVETDENVFSGSTGTEAVWFMWTARPQAELEEARALAFASDEGQIPSSLLPTFLKREDLSRAEASKDAEQRRTVLRGHGDVVAHLLRLEYR